MKKIVLALLFFTATAFAQSPFDGTWVSDLGAAQFSKKPHTYELNKGMYTCSTCVPKISVKADGQGSGGLGIELLQHRGDPRGGCQHGGGS